MGGLLQDVWDRIRKSIRETLVRSCKNPFRMPSKGGVLKDVWDRNSKSIRKTFVSSCRNPFRMPCMGGLLQNFSSRIRWTNHEVNQRNFLPDTYQDRDSLIQYIWASTLLINTNCVAMLQASH